MKKGSAQSALRILLSSGGVMLILWSSINLDTSKGSVTQLLFVVLIKHDIGLFEKYSVHQKTVVMMALRLQLTKHSDLGFSFCIIYIM